MNLYLRRSFLLLILCSSLFSCKKEAQVNYPQSFSFSSITQKTAVRLFANKVEIKDTATINRYIKEYDSSFFSLQSLKGMVGQPKITLQSADSAQVDHGWGAAKYAYKKSGDLFLFTSVDSNYSEFSASGPHLFVYNDPNASVVTPATGFNSQSKNILVAHGTSNTLNVSVVAYIYYTRSSSASYVFELSTFNEFNEDFVKTMGVNDTLAIQESTLTMKN